MEKGILVWTGFILGIAGFSIGLRLFRPVQKTTITIQTVGCGPLSDLKSNRLHDGDSFLVILDGDTLHNTIVENGEFVRK